MRECIAAVRPRAVFEVPDILDHLLRTRSPVSDLDPVAAHVAEHVTGTTDRGPLS